jgi:hypothetical protein
VSRLVRRVVSLDPICLQPYNVASTSDVIPLHRFNRGNLCRLRRVHKSIGHPPTHQASHPEPPKKPFFGVPQIQLHHDTKHAIHNNPPFSPVGGEMPSVIAYAVTFVLVFSAVVFIVLFGPAPRFRYVVPPPLPVSHATGVDWGLGIRL